MKYYTINSSTESNVIGYYPQTNSRLAHNLNTNNSYRNVFWDEFPGFLPDFEIDINSESKPTNFLDRSPLIFGFLIDLDFKNILESHNLPPHRFYPVKVFYKGQLLNYYWFHFIYDMWQFVNTQKSKIEWIQKVSGKTIKEFSFDSKEHIKSLKKEVTFEEGMILKEVVFDTNFMNEDIIKITDTFYIPLISEKLKNALTKAGMTGFETREFDRIRFEDCI